MYVRIFTVSYHVNIVTSSNGSAVDGNNNTFKYIAGSDLNLTCLVTPTPPANSEFSWKCSTGCFADMKMGQTISVSDLNTTDSGSIACSLATGHSDYHSETFTLLVSGQ